MHDCRSCCIGFIAYKFYLLKSIPALFLVVIGACKKSDILELQFLFYWEFAFRTGFLLVLVAFSCLRVIAILLIMVIDQ